MPVVITSIIIFLTVLWCYRVMLLRYFIFKKVYVIFFNVWKNKFLKKGWTTQIPTFFFTIFCNKCCFFALAWVFDKNRVYRFKDIIIENIFLKNFVIWISGTYSLKKNRRGNYFETARYQTGTGQYWNTSFQGIPLSLC